MLTLRGRLGLASLLASPYLRSYYWLFLLLDLRLIQQRLKPVQQAIEPGFRRHREADHPGEGNGGGGAAAELGSDVETVRTELS